MPTTETPFLVFWRALDAELERIHEYPTRAAEATGWDEHWDRPRYVAAQVAARRVRIEAKREIAP